MGSILPAFGALFWISYLLSYNDALVFKFTNAVCETYNESWFHIYSCRLHAVSRNKTTFDFNGTILHPANDVALNIQVLKKASGYKPWIVKASIDVCRFLKKPYNPTAILVFNLFKEFSNFYHHCPVNGTQYVIGLYPRYELLRVPLPSGEYLLSMLWFFDKKPQFITKVYFDFNDYLINQ